MPIALGMWALAAYAQEIVVEPFLQEAAPDSVWIVWETDSGDGSVVEWGATDALGQSTSGTVHDGNAGSKIHEVHLTGLSPATRTWYRARTGDTTSPVRTFTTPALPSADAPFTMVAVSDMQQSAQDPDKWGEIVQDGIVATLAGGDPSAIDAEIGFVIAAGDLVEAGRDYDRWAEEFFGPAAELFGRVPIYPVLGNHEDDSPYYFAYLHLPDNGSPGFEEHWWWLDHGNVRIIGLDSNAGYWSTTQQDWLYDTLTDACSDPDVDFVFAQLHHPHHSELWTPGNSIFTGTIVDLLEEFTTDCGKPSVHFFGHTHAYSRGASREHRHLMVNVATAGGAVDRWGEQAQRDYPEFSVSTDDWGFVQVDVTAGDDPSFALTRYSRGNRDGVVDNVVTDTVVVRRDDASPNTPIASSPVGLPAGDCFTLRGGPFADPDGDAHAASEWQIARTCDGFDEPVWTSWRQGRNLYFGVDRQKGDDLTDEVVHHAVSDGTYCFRVRYRDPGLTWSEWSEPTPFSVGPFARTGNLLGDDDLGRPLADEAEWAVEVDSHAEEIDGGSYAWVSARLLGPAGDTPTVRLVFRDGAGAEIDRALVAVPGAGGVFALEHSVAVPTGTRVIDVQAASVTGTFLDALSLALGPADPIDCDPPPPVIVPVDEPGPCGCGGGSSPMLAAWVVALLAARRRRTR